MEQVKCISNYGIQDYLTMGNIYNVIRAEVDLGGEKFYVMNDQNKLDWYLGSRFKVIAETQTNNEPKTEKKQTDRKIRVFETGAIRSSNEGRERFDFISPLALKELAQYLATSENSFAQVNYFKGIPENACLESLLRHINDYQLNGKKSEAVALLFNAVALVHTIALKERGEYVKVQEGTRLISESEYKNLQINYDYKKK
jgi:hypothetical protein